MMQPSTAPTTVAVMFVSLVVVAGVSKSSDLIEAHLISVVALVGCVDLADTQQS